MNFDFPYEDILHLPHHISDSRSPMSMHDRAAQFSPFDALTGYDDCIDEVNRLSSLPCASSSGTELHRY